SLSSALWCCLFTLCPCLFSSPASSALSTLSLHDALPIFGGHCIPRRHDPLLFLRSLQACGGQGISGYVVVVDQPRWHHTSLLVESPPDAREDPIRFRGKHRLQRRVVLGLERQLLDSVSAINGRNELPYAA